MRSQDEHAHFPDFYSDNTWSSESFPSMPRDEYRDARKEPMAVRSGESPSGKSKKQTPKEQTAKDNYENTGSKSEDDALRTAQLEEQKVTQTRRTCPLETLSFSSKSEAACGIMLEKYVQDFQLVPGKTFQIPVGSKKIDFQLEGVFVEFHPIQLRHEFASKKAYEQFKVAIGRLEDWQKNELQEILSEEFQMQYKKGRVNILGCFDETKNSEVIVCYSGSDFVDNVLMRFGSRSELPSRNKLLEEWNSLRNGMKQRFHHTEE
ncbi:MAG: hypothetical protein ACO3XO_07950 [Bdellovibrionota bacterium]